MLDSLSQKINLKVNGFQIILNQELNESELKSHKFKKVGFFNRIIIKFQKSGFPDYPLFECLLKISMSAE